MYSKWVCFEAEMKRALICANARMCKIYKDKETVGYERV